MHEYSIVQALLDQIEEVAKENNAKEVKKIFVKIGVMSGVEPDLLQIAFDTFKQNTICNNAKFIIDIQKIKIRCKNCNKINELEKNEYECPECNSIDFDVIDGEEMYLMSLELE